MLETETTNPAVGDQLRLIGSSLRRTLTYPTTLLYPLCKSVLTVCIVVVAIGGFFVPFAGIGPDVPIGYGTMLLAAGACVILLYVLTPILAVGLDVAYCYELRELRRGTRPLPGSGLVFAIRRLPRITLGALAVSGTFLAGYATNTESLRVGSGVLDILLAPALVSEDRSVSDLVTHIDAVAADQWGTTGLAVYGVGTVSKALGTASIACAVGIVSSYWLGLLPLVTTIWQALLLAIGVVLGGLALTTFCKSLVDGPVAMALYEQAKADDGTTSLALDSLREAL